MKSIFSIVLTAVMLLSVLTGCGRRNRNDGNTVVNNTPAAATTVPAGNTPGTAVNGTEAGNATDRVENGVNNAVGGVENGVNNVVGGVENGVNDVIDGVENGVNDLLGDDGVVNGDVDDGRVEEDNAKTDAAKATATPQAR